MRVFLLLLIGEFSTVKHECSNAKIGIHFLDFMKIAYQPILVIQGKQCDGSEQDGKYSLHSYAKQSSGEPD